jgi:sortase A
MGTHAMDYTADRGGPFARNEGPARNWMRAAAPGIAFRFSPDESSPIGGAARGSAARSSDSIQLRRAVTVFCIVLLASVGIASFGHGIYIYAKAQLAQVLLHRAWDRQRDTGSAVKPWPWADTHPIARLVVPARDANVLVLAGASGRTLAFGPGHLDGSAQPGDPGNAVITAHRDTHFRFLKDVAPGDELLVERTDGGTRHFRIRASYVADYRELRLPRDTAVPTLTLVTCFPFDALNPGGPLRYVVVAEAA